MSELETLLQQKGYICYPQDHAEPVYHKNIQVHDVAVDIFFEKVHGPQWQINIEIEAEKVLLEKRITYEQAVFLLKSDFMITASLVHNPDSISRLTQVVHWLDNLLRFKK